MRKNVNISSSEPLCNISMVLRKLILKFCIFPVYATPYFVAVFWVVISDTVRVVSSLALTLFSTIYRVQYIIDEVRFFNYSLPSVNYLVRGHLLFFF